jgi:glutamate-ammonia-ligase adenylyltransferase
MPDPARLASELTDRYPEPWVRHHLATFSADYFAAFSAEDVSRHLGRVLALSDEHPVAVEVWPCGPGAWRVEAVGFDAFQFLSTLCTLLAIHGLSIVEGRAFTSDPRRAPSSEAAPRRFRRPGRPSATTLAREPDRRPKIVDRFRVRWAGGHGSAPDWAAFEGELTDLARRLRAERSEEVHRRLIPRFVAVLGRHRPEPVGLDPIDLTIDADPSAPATLVRVRGRDSFGFLSLTASALALCGVMIVEADVRTRGRRVHDTFRVTDRFGRRIEGAPRLRELRLSLVLIEHYSAYLPHATNPEAALVHFSRFAAETMARPDWGEDYAALDRPEVLDALVRVLGESDFLWEDFLHAQPENLLPMVVDPGQWRRARTPAELAAERDAALAQSADLDGKARALRLFRDREFFRAGVRAILGLCGGPGGFSAELSEVAEALLRGAERVAREELAPVLPRRADGRPVPSALLALGKCGGRELGFGSDLELMLIYDDRDVAENLEPAGVGAGFDRLVATLRQVLAAPRGGTFDTDFRLRPYGRAGTPATALSAFAGYYRSGGPAWGYERQALIKLRAVAGDPGLGREVEALRDRFVYGPEPFDLDGFRRLRRLQVEQLVRPGTVNAKYSPGALVDVEYLVQALQIAQGARDPSVRTPSTLTAIGALEAAGRLSPGRAATLRAAYHFFRALTDALRVVHGHAKDLTVPPDGSEEFRRLTRRLRRQDPAPLRDELDRTLREVAALWAEADRLLGVAE